MKKKAVFETIAINDFDYNDAVWRSACRLYGGSNRIR